MGLSLNEDRTYVKCYMGDTGLLISHTFDENRISDVSFIGNLIGKTVGERGYVLRERNCPDVGGCRAQTVLLRDTIKHRNDMEIDFPVEPQQTEI